MKAPIRIGAIGCGPMFSGYHAPAISRIPDLELTALCDIDEARLQQAAARFRVAHTFACFEEMLDSGKVDAVSIIGPPSLHVVGARACLERQIPFLTEKPLAITVGEASQLAELATRLGDCGQVGYMMRFSPAQRLAWRISRSSEFGPILFVATNHLSKANMRPVWNKTDMVEGFVHLHGVHAIDLWRFFGGDPVEVSASVAGLTMSEDGRSGHGSVLACVRTANGPHGTIHVKAGASHNSDVNADVMGAHSRIRVENSQGVTYEHGHEWIQRAMADDVLEQVFLPDQPAGEFVGTGLIMHSYPDFFRYEWMAFARALLDCKPLSPSIVDGYRTVCLTEAICASLRGGGAWRQVVQ